MSARGEPFVAQVSPDLIDSAHRGDATYYPMYLNQKADSMMVPVVVTPLLPDDPRPGDEMLYGGHRVVEVIGPPCAYMSGGHHFVPVADFETGEAFVAAISRLRRPPVMKTFRLRDGTYFPGVKAESREAALKLIADALEEIP